MDVFSGLSLDRQDDPAGLLLQQEGVKVASYPLDYGKVPDHLFALCMEQDGERMRKYAMHHEQAAAESMLYFLKTGHRLPDEVQKIAARHLIEGASWYDLPVPAALEKVAFGSFLRGVGGAAVNGLKNAVKNPLQSGGKLVGAATTLGSVQGALSSAKNNVQQAAGAGGNILPLSHFGG